MAKMFVHYNGTIAAFKAAKDDSGVLLSEKYKNHIVFIKGEAGGAIYTHEKYFGDVEALKYFSKVSDGTKVAEAAGPNGTITFTANDPALLAVDATSKGVTISLKDTFVNKVNNTAAALGAKNSAAQTGEEATAFGRIKNLEEIVAGLTGDESGEQPQSVQGQISAAIQALDVDAKAGDYVASVAQVDGKIEATMGTFNFDAKGAAADVKTELIGTASDNASASTIAGAKKYADEAAGLAKGYADTQDAATLSAAKTYAKEYADGLAANYDAAGAAGTAKSEVIGASGDASTADTIYGAKKHAEEKAAAAEAAAKSYAEGLVATGSALEVRVKANEDAIVVLKGEGEGSVKKTVADAVADVVASAPENFDTLKEVADWIANDTTGAASMQNAIATLNGDVTKEGSVAKQVKDAVDAEAAIARAAEEANANAIAVLNGTEAGSVAKAVADAKSAIDAYTINGKTLSSNPVLGASDINVAEGKTLAQAISALESAVGTGGTVDTQIANAIADLDATVGEASVAEGKHVAVQVVEVDGKLTAVNVSESDIASAQGLTNEIARAEEAEGQLAGRLDIIEGEGDGSIKKAVATAQNTLQGNIDKKVDQTAYDAKIKELADMWNWVEL